MTSFLESLTSALRLRVKCPICKAKPSEPCTDTNLGHKLDKPHESRK